MSMTWGNFRTIIRRSILKDPNKTTWTDDSVLLDLFGWAQDSFCAHTAVPTSITIDPAVQTNNLPANLFADLEDTGALYYINGTNVSIIPPAKPLDYGATRDVTFTVFGDTFILTAEPDPSTSLKLFYFAYYPTPTSDDSLITLPRWSYNAVAHLVGALAHTSVSVQSAGIDRWKDRRTDSGTPEDNALRVQQQWMFKVYENELARYPNQSRENYYAHMIVTP